MQRRTTQKTVVSATPIITRPTASFVRPADTTAYAVGDLVANSTTAGSVAAMSLTVARDDYSQPGIGGFMVRRVKLHKSSVSVTAADFRVHFFGVGAITFANGDNGAFSTNQVANYLGAFDVTIDRAFTDGAAGFGVPVLGAELGAILATGYAVQAAIEARAAYTPGNAETFTLTLENYPV